MTAQDYITSSLTQVSLPSDRHLYTFRVRACSDVEVILRAGSTEGEEFVTLTIGAESNTKTQIKVDDQIVTNVSTPDIVSCTEHRSFTLRWYEETFEVYQYGISGRQILAYVGEHINHIMNVYDITIATPADVMGDWAISQGQGMYTPNMNTYTKCSITF